MVSSKKFPNYPQKKISHKLYFIYENGMEKNQ